MTAPAIDVDGLVRSLRALGMGRGRVLAGIAGPPGSGKSTVAEAVVAALEAAEAGSAALLPMDGFHYDDLHLVPAGLRPRKGAPETFDVGGLLHVLKRLRDADEAIVAVPVFDRSIEIARAGARLIPRSARIIVVEGNYLLLRQPPWADLRPLFDVTVLVETPEAELRRRLTARWEHYGIAPEEIARKVEGNDLPNGRFVMAESTEPDFRLAN